jgi:DNA-binding LacI/PurR family transcriptional regulator
MKERKAQQVLENMLADIRSGMMEPGEELDSVRTLCLRYRTCIATMSKILAQMREDGLISLSQGKKTVLQRRPGQQLGLLYYGKKELPYDQFGRNFYRGIANIVNAHPEYALVLFNAGTLSETKLHQALASDFVGYIIIGTLETNPVFKAQFEQHLKAQSLPLAQFLFADEPPCTENCTTIFCDYETSFRRILQELAKQGVHSPIIIEDCEDIRSHKYASFQRAYTSVFGAPFDDDAQLVLSRQPEPDMAYHDIRAKLQERPDADAAIALADDFLPALARALYDLKRNIPFTGCDNVSQSRLVIPAATTIDLHLYHVGQIIGQELLTRVSNQRTPLPYKSITVPSEIIFRESTNR